MEAILKITGLASNAFCGCLHSGLPSDSLCSLFSPHPIDRTFSVLCCSKTVTICSWMNFPLHHAGSSASGY